MVTSIVCEFSLIKCVLFSVLWCRWIPPWRTAGSLHFTSSEFIYDKIFTSEGDSKCLTSHQSFQASKTNDITRIWAVGQKRKGELVLSVLTA